MILEQQLTDFGIILLFIIGSIVMLVAGLITGQLIRPKRPNPEKLSSYECGEDPVTAAWGQFNVRFYIFALIFVLFDVEIVFLFPWSTIFSDRNLIAASAGTWGWFSLLEIFVFVGILALGLAYAWGKGFLEWIKPKTRTSDYNSHIPKELYEKINLNQEKKVDKKSSLYRST